MRNIILLFTIVCIAVTANADLFAQEHEGVERISRLYNFWERAHDVVVSEDYAFVAAGLSGLQVLDISDRENPEIVTYLDYFGGARSQQAMTTRDDVIFLVDKSSGLHIIDVQDPEDPIEMGLCEVAGDALHICVEGDYAYIATGDSGLGIVDISDFEFPELIDYHFTGGNTQQVTVIDETAYVADSESGLVVFDVSNPLEPNEIASYELRLGAESILVNGEIAYVVSEPYLHALDISDINNGDIQPVTEYRTDTPARTAIRDDLFYLAANSYDRPYLHILDISNPMEFSLTGSTYIGFGRGSGTVQGMCIEGDYAYISGNLVLERESWGLETVDISTPRSPQEVGTFSSMGNIHDVVVAGDYAYMAGFYSGFRIADISDMENPVEVGRFDFPSSLSRVRQVVVEGNYAFLGVDNSDDQGLWIMDITDPEEPQEVGHLNTELFFYSLYIHGDFAYISTFDGLYIVDITQADAPQLLTNYEMQNHEYYSVYVSGNYAYVIGASWRLSWSILFIIDISDPENPEQLGQIQTQTVAGNVSVSGDYAYVTDFQSGLMIVDVSNPEEPQEVSLLDTEDWASDLFVQDSLVYVTDRYKGLRVINVSDPENPFEIGYYDTPGYALGVYVVDGIAFIADDTNLGIYDCTDDMVVELEKPQPQPYDFCISSIYPNPFNSTTTITYSLPTASIVELKLFNLTGREVAVLVNDLKTAGVHTANLKANNLPSGLYFVQLNSETKTMTQKVMLVK